MRYLGVPLDLAELSALVAGGEDFDQLVGSFIDFNQHLVRTNRKHEAVWNFLAEPPLLAGVIEDGGVWDAFLAAMTEKLFEDWALGNPPAWVEGAARALNHPHYTIKTRDQAFLEKLRRISPEPFKKRNLFYTQKVLARC